MTKNYASEQNRTEQNRRLSYVDIAKGIGIFLVVLGHTARGNIIIWIYSFHMPLFFFISGFLTTEDKLRKVSVNEYLKKKALGLLVPYFLFLALTYIYWIAVEHYVRPFDTGPFWFLPVLFVIEISFMFLFHKQNTSILKMSIILIVTAIAISLESIVNEFIPLFECLSGLFFFTFGFVFKVSILNLRKNITTLSILIGTFLINFNASMFNGRVDMRTASFGNGIIFILSAIAGIYFVLTLSIFIDKCRPLEYIGRYSIVILCTHEQIKRVIIVILSMILSIGTEDLRNNIVLSVITTVLILIIEVVVIKTLLLIKNRTSNRKFYWLLDFIK